MVMFSRSFILLLSPWVMQFRALRVVEPCEINSSSTIVMSERRWRLDTSALVCWNVIYDFKGKHYNCFVSLIAGCSILAWSSLSLDDETDWILEVILEPRVVVPLPSCKVLSIFMLLTPFPFKFLERLMPVTFSCEWPFLAVITLIFLSLLLPWECEYCLRKDGVTARSGTRAVAKQQLGISSFWLMESW